MKCSMIKINFGCYTQMFKGWINIDVLPLERYAAEHGFNFIRLDVRNPLPFPDDYADIVYHSHLIEHLTIEQAINFLKECRRIMKPGAVMRVSTPDLDIFIDAYLKGDMDKFSKAQPEIYSKFKTQAMKFSLIIFGNLGYTQERYWGHFMIYNEESLRELLELAGFNKIFRVTHKTSINSQLQKEINEGTFYDTWTDHSLIMEAVK